MSSGRDRLSTLFLISKSSMDKLSPSLPPGSVALVEWWARFIVMAVSLCINWNIWNWYIKYSGTYICKVQSIQIRTLKTDSKDSSTHLLFNLGSEKRKYNIEVSSEPSKQWIIRVMSPPESASVMMKSKEYLWHTFRVCVLSFYFI